MIIGCFVGFASSQIKSSNFLYAAFIALFLVKNERECDKNLLSTVGDCSFGIYFSHMAVMWDVSKVLLVVGGRNLVCSLAFYIYLYFNPIFHFCVACEEDI